MIDTCEFRPITFQDEVFPPSLMGISILEPVLDIEEEELGEWLWRLPICKGVTKRAPAERCARCAMQTVDLMLEMRQAVLEGIADRLAEFGFDPESTYREWIHSLLRIAMLSRREEDDCVWWSPAHEMDRYAGEAGRMKLEEILERLEQDYPRER
ncbi:hypothetical protein [Luteolibacter sp. Populi]|uniref:hypothetical protein n=1 Tax=Luteolibacter sp. Populi TaxID=3230487 RepID=UPI0034677267